MKKCPRCGGEARRSHKHGFIQKRILHPLRIRPFRCRDCGTLFYRFSSKGDQNHHRGQASNASVFNQAKDGNGHFKELIAQIQAKETQLGLGKQDNRMTDELRRLREQAAQEGLTATSEAVRQASGAPGNGDSKPPEMQKAVSRGKQRGSQGALTKTPGLKEIRPAELFPETKTS